MSVDLFLYSPTPEIATREQLRSLLESKGWQVLILSDWWKMSIADEGTIGHEDLIIGCKDASGIAQVTELVLRSDRQATDSLLGQRRFGNCALGANDASNIDETEIEELAAELEDEAASILRKSQRRYDISFKGHQTAKSGYLAEDTWRSLGKLCGGLLEDPQRGKGYIVRIGEDPIDACEKKPWWRIW